MHIWGGSSIKFWIQWLHECINKNRHIWCWRKLSRRRTPKVVRYEFSECRFWDHLKTHSTNEYTVYPPGKLRYPLPQVFLSRWFFELPKVGYVTSLQGSRCFKVVGAKIQSSRSSRYPHQSVPTWMFPKIVWVFPPNHPLKNRVFHHKSYKPSILGVVPPPIFGLPPTWTRWKTHVKSLCFEVCATHKVRPKDPKKVAMTPKEVQEQLMMLGGFFVCWLFFGEEGKGVGWLVGFSCVKMC